MLIEIFPLSSQGLPLWTTFASKPVYLGEEVTLQNLLRDAKEFEIIKLYEKIRRQMAGQMETPLQKLGIGLNRTPLAESHREAKCRLFISVSTLLCQSRRRVGADHIQHRRVGCMERANHARHLHITGHKRGHSAQAHGLRHCDHGDIRRDIAYRQHRTSAEEQTTKAKHEEFRVAVVGLRDSWMDGGFPGWRVL